MLIGERIRDIREAKNLSQGDLEERSGLVRVYISRIENGHTIPSVETLEKLAQALGIALYQLFYEGKQEPPPAPDGNSNEDVAGMSRKQIRYWKTFRTHLGRLREVDRQLLLAVAEQMAKR